MGCKRGQRTKGQYAKKDVIIGCIGSVCDSLRLTLARAVSVSEFIAATLHMAKSIDMNIAGQQRYYALFLPESNTCAIHVDSGSRIERSSLTCIFPQAVPVLTWRGSSDYSTCDCSHVSSGLFGRFNVVWSSSPIATPTCLSPPSQTATHSSSPPNPSLSDLMSYPVSVVLLSHT